MKKCPFCKADIEDNAHFCVFCMSPLQEKTTVENIDQNHKRWLYILATFLLLTLIFGIIMFALSKNSVNNNSSETLLQSETINFYDNSELTNNTDIADNDQKSTDNNNLNNDNKTNQTNNDNNNGLQNNNNNNDKNGKVQNDNNTNQNNKTNTANGTVTQSPQDTQTDTNPTTTPTQPLDTVPETDDTDTDNTTDDTNNTLEDENSNQQGNDDNSNTGGSSEEPSGDNTPVKTEAVYIYRDAVAADCYTEGNIPAQPITDVIVITGVSTAASDGIYNIPETIDGKKVGGIMPSAFCDSAISGTVKKVVVPTSVKTIWQNAFSNCYNLTDIYLSGKIINIYESAFANKDKRNGTLTIHCSSDCKTFGYYYYRNIANNYSAQYKQWNGGAIE